MISLNSLCLIGVRSPSRKTLSILIYVYKMENMRMPEVKALAREHRLRGYSRLREAELIELLQDNEPQAPRRPHPNRPPPPPAQMSTWEPNRPPQMSTWEPECEQENEVRQPELEAPLTKDN